MFRKVFIVFIVMFFTSTAARQLLIKTEGIVQHSTVMALTSPWRDSATAASDEESFDGQVMFGGEVKDVEDGEDGTDYKAKVLKKKVANAVRKGKEDLKLASSF